MKKWTKIGAKERVTRFALIGLSVGALTALTASDPFVDASRSIVSAQNNPLIAHANTVDVPPDIDYLKRRAQTFNGSVGAQLKLGEIFSGQIDTIVNTNTRRRESPYADELFDDPQRNRIEAFYWYSLAAAQLDHADMLREASGGKIESLSKADRDNARKANRRMNTMRSGSRTKGIRGPSLWTAQSMFVDTYRTGCAPAFFILGEFYKNGRFVDKSAYDAYVWMHAAEKRGFPTANLIAEEYRGRIMVNQQFLASSEANTLIASCGGGSGGSWMAGGGAGNGSGSISSPGWGSDFQTSRKNYTEGSNRTEGPGNVDSHHSSQSAFDMGNGHLAAGDIAKAKIFYEVAISKEPYSTAAIAASRQLQALTLSCSMRDDRVVRMSGSNNRDRVHDIGWDRLQLALKALGYYTKYVDSQPGQETRRAIRSFQREELNVDETGYLTTDQRVELICLAAQDVRDADSQIQLGIMYARGIGLNCNTAAAHAWFQRAADQGHPTALYNLGLMYLEGFYDRQAPGKSPYSKKQIGNNPYTGKASLVTPRRVIDPQMARFFFKEAQEKGHVGGGGSKSAAQMIAKIDRQGAGALAKLPGVIGCIDYEIEEDLLDLQREVLSLHVDVSDLVYAWENEGQTCRDIGAVEVARDRFSQLQKRGKDRWDSVEKYEPRYVRDMGQSDSAALQEGDLSTQNAGASQAAEEGRRLPISDTRKVLGDIGAGLDKLKACKMNDGRS